MPENEMTVRQSLGYWNVKPGPLPVARLAVEIGIGVSGGVASGVGASDGDGLAHAAAPTRTPRS